MPRPVQLLNARATTSSRPPQYSILALEPMVPDPGGTGTSIVRELDEE